MIHRTLAASAAMATLSAVSLAQTSIPAVVVTVTNAQPARGMLLTPPWVGIHDGTFDTYDGGQPASVPLGGNEIEAVAEDGNNGPLTATFASRLPNAPQVMGLAGPTGPLSPGQSARTTLLVDPTLYRYFSYASMIIPSNDFFIANGSPLAHPLFDATGAFVGRPFVVSGDETNDAGTEVNDEIATNVAFLAQSAPDTGTAEGGVVQTPAPGFAAGGALAYPDGILNYPVFGLGDFNDADDRIARFDFRFVDLGGEVRLAAELLPTNEVQPDEVSSAGFGSALAVGINGDQLGIRIDTEGLSGPITMAHLHLGAAGTNGPVVVNLTPSIFPDGRRLRTFVLEPDLMGPLGGESFVELLREIAAGNVYVNVHTAAFPAGEVRGQLELASF
ncbi:MAG: spondin domain-containing protein [Planctomycetota bacterium]